MSYRIRVLETGAVFDAQPGEALLAAAGRQGVRLPHECSFGGCGTCRVRLLEGRVAYEELTLALTEEEAEAGLALACQARACADLVISLERADDAPPAQRCEAVVRDVAHWTPQVLNLHLEIEADGFLFRPGQYMNVLLDDGGHRSFSMASAPAGNQVDFHVRRIPGGRFTDRGLRGLAAGDRLAVEIPLGRFGYHAEDFRPVVMAATGTAYALLLQGTDWGRPALFVHASVANLMWAYLIGHAGLAVLHHLTGSDIFSRMFWRRPGRLPQPAGARQ